MEVQRMTWMTTSKDQELVKENINLKVEIATLRKQLQDKDSTQGQIEGITFIPRKEASR